MTMKNLLKIAINVVASLFVVLSGTMQAVKADEVSLDFSVPETDTAIAAPTSPASNTQPLEFGEADRILPESAIADSSLAFEPSVQPSEKPAKHLALDFNTPDVNSPPVPVAPDFSTPTEPNYSPPAFKKPSPNAKQIVTALRRAIVGQESAGKFWVINPDSGALGYGQLMEFNVAPWTKAAIGRALTPEEFLANPHLQIKTIDHKLTQYLRRELSYTGGVSEELAIRRVASTWYSGNPNLWNNTNPQYSNGRRYPSISSYTRSVWKRYQREIG